MLQLPILDLLLIPKSQLQPVGLISSAWTGVPFLANDEKTETMSDLIQVAYLAALFAEK